MAGRRTNLALLALLAAALATGGLAYAIGTGWSRWAVVGHGAAGLGILLLAPWKSVIARRGLRRRRPGSWASLFFAVLVAVALVAGIAHSTGVLRSAGGVTAMQVHVGAALVSVPFAFWHLFTRPVRPRRSDLSRRAFLRSAALGAGSLAVYGALSGLVWVTRLPGRARRFTGSYETGSFRPDAMPVTQWLNDSVPQVDGASWFLSIRGAGREVRRLSLDELDRRRERVQATIDCTGGWFATQDWEGVRMDALLPADLQGRSIEVRSVTGYARRFPMRDAPNLWVATRVGSGLLSSGHGYPARVVSPGRRGFWWVKWIASIEVNDAPWWLQPPFPLT
jgi:DMSO/TMAO reductase YedYZ molybdopterin-dependent catalytic subunit